MLKEQATLYIRENMTTIFMAAGFVVFSLLLLILIQVTRTRRAVHKICKKIYRYFDVVFAEEPQETSPEKEERAQEEPLSTYIKTEEPRLQTEDQKIAEDAKLLMDVISEVF